MTNVVHVRLRAGRAVEVAMDGSHRSVRRQLPGPLLLELAAQHPAGVVTWCELDAADLLSPPERWPELLDGPHQVRSAGLVHGEDPWLATIGAADFDSALLLPPPSDRPFGTWLLSPLAGVASASALLAAGAPPEDLPLPSWVVCLGHRAFRAGALLWSDPGLITVDRRHERRAVHDAATTAAVVRHAFGRRFLGPWVASQPDARRTVEAATQAARAMVRGDVDRPPAAVRWPEPAEVLPDRRPAVDVVIPTVGRRALLLDTLDDLARQTLVPRKVVVVEQTRGAPAGLPIDGSRWPFPFEHVLIEPLGAGNARNVGISRGDAEWVLLLDDDERFAPDMLHRLWARLHDSGAGAITARLDMVTPDELGSAGELPAALRSRPAGPAISMWPGFGSGCALLRRSLLAEAGGFDRRLDGGFGEDTELGVRLRRAGATVVLATDPPVAHLKAPVGGMRTPFPHPWRSDPVRPRPSPTVLLARRSFETPAMASGYRIHWWLDGIRREGLSFRPHRRWRQWRSAQRWSDHLARGASITSEPSVVSSSVPPAVGPADPAARTP